MPAARSPRAPRTREPRPAVERRASPLSAVHVLQDRVVEHRFGCPELWLRCSRRPRQAFIGRRRAITVRAREVLSHYDRALERLRAGDWSGFGAELDALRPPTSFPKTSSFTGHPKSRHVLTRTPEISQQISLWNQMGSKVIRGNLHVIPIENSLLYVSPLYLRAETGQLPELKHRQTGRSPWSAAAALREAELEECPPAPDGSTMCWTKGDVMTPEGRKAQWAVVGVARVLISAPTCLSPQCARSADRQRRLEAA